MSSNAPSKDADVSTMDDRLASLEVTEGQANIRSTDTSVDGAARPSEDGASRPSEDGELVLDPKLWKPHPPTEECPVCFVPLPLAEVKSTYWVCCGKLICNGCEAETMRAREVINAKRAKKKLLPLDNACPFCRTVPNDSASEYEKRIRKGDAQATLNLAFFNRNGDTKKRIPKNEVKSLELFHHAADDLDYSVAMAELGFIYSYGVDGAPKDEKKGRKYLEDAVKMGNVTARNSLACVEAESGNIKLAIQHWKLAAGAGHSVAMKNLWATFYGGMFGKDNLEETLRAHKAACDSMNSEERKRYALWEKAEVEGDDALEKVLRSYYNGDIKAKELNLALKALRKTDG